MGAGCGCRHALSSAARRLSSHSEVTASGVLELVGNTPLVELTRLSPEGVRLYAKLEGQNPTGSIKDRVAKAMIEAAEASGELEPGRELLEPTSGNTGISLAMVARVKGYRLTCVVPENVTEERLKLLRLLGAELILSPGAEGSNGAVTLALALAEREPRYYLPFQYGNDANPRAHYEGTGAEIAAELERVDVVVAGLGTGGTLMGVGRRLREQFPDVVVAAAEPLPGDPVLGLRSLEDGYVPPILDVGQLDRKILVSNADSVAGMRALLEREAIFAGVSSGGVLHVAQAPRGGAGRRCGRRDPRGRRLEVPVRAALGVRGRRARHGARGLVVVPAAIRAELLAHAREEAPNEACGLVAFREGVAERYLPAENALESPYRFELRPRDPADFFLEDEGYELAVFHSHPQSEPKPSRTDLEHIGLWEGRPYLILRADTGELAGWRISNGGVEALPLSE